MMFNSTEVEMFEGEYCVFRCTSAGVHAGVLESHSAGEAVVRDARRLWFWSAAGGVALSGVAQFGLKKTGSKIDVVVPRMLIRGVDEIIPCSAVAEESIRGYK